MYKARNAGTGKWQTLLLSTRKGIDLQRQLSSSQYFTEVVKNV